MKEKVWVHLRSSELNSQLAFYAICISRHRYPSEVLKMFAQLCFQKKGRGRKRSEPAFTRGGGTCDWLSIVKATMKSITVTCLVYTYFTCQTQAQRHSLSCHPSGNWFVKESFDLYVYAFSPWWNDSMKVLKVNNSLGWNSSIDSGTTYKESNWFL